MPFSKTPVNSTYQTKEIKLVHTLNSRNTLATQDVDYLNSYVEIINNQTTGQKEINLVKRDGSSVFTSAVGTGGIRGGFLWKDQQKIFLAIQNNIYVYNADSGFLITTLAGVFTTTSGYVGFEEFSYSTNSTKLVVTDGVKLSTIDTSNTVAASTDPDLPTPHLPYPVVLDGYLFLVKAVSADIYNSDNDDPLAWTSGNFITAEMRPDQLYRIGLLNNYIVAFGNKSIEYFYDAGNPTGSPLSRNDSPIKSVGYIGGFAQYGNKIFFVGETSESIPDVFVLEDFKITPMSNDAVRRHLASVSTDGVNSLKAGIVSHNGHDFYVLYTGIYTYVNEIESKLWTRWAYQGGASFPLTLSLQHFGPTGYHNYFALENVQSLQKFNTTLYQDAGVAFTAWAITDNELFDTYNQKVINRLTLWGDKPTASQPILVQWSDDDYQNYNSGQYLDMFQEMPCIYRCGRFRRRAHKLSYTGNLPLRITKIEVDINMGAT